MPVLTIKWHRLCNSFDLVLQTVKQDRLEIKDLVGWNYRKATNSDVLEYLVQKSGNFVFDERTNTRYKAKAVIVGNYDSAYALSKTWLGIQVSDDEGWQTVYTASSDFKAHGLDFTFNLLDSVSGAIWFGQME